MPRHHDMEVMAAAPDTVLVRLTASPEAVKERLRANPAGHGPIKEADIEDVLTRFTDEFGSSLICRRFTLDTTTTTPAETLRAFFDQIQTFRSPADRLRMPGPGVLQPS